MIEITDKRLVHDTLVGDLMFGDTCMYNGALVQRVNAGKYITCISERCPVLVISTGEIVYVPSEQKVQQVSITIEVHNL